MAPAAPEPSASAPQPALPRDARVIALILASKGIDDTTPQVLHQLLEFAHRYTTDILLDSLTYSEHAGKGGKLDVEDVSLAVQAKVNWSFKEGGERDYLTSMAQQINSNPLPPVPETPFLRLPNARDLLTAPNFNLVPNKPPAGYSNSNLIDAAFENEGDDSAGEDHDHEHDDDEEEEGVEGEDDSNAGGTPRPGQPNGSGSGGGGGGGGDRGPVDENYDEDDDDDMEEMPLEPVSLGGAEAGGVGVGVGLVGGAQKREREEDDDYDE